MFWPAMFALLLATLGAFAVARQDREHRPVAWVLLVWLASNLGRHALAATVLRVPGPYAGGARAAFHVEQALFLAALFSVPALSWWTFRRDPWPPVACYAVALAACIVGYPTLRGAVLGRVYGALTAVAVVLSLAAVGMSRTRRNVTASGECHTLISLILTAGLVATLLGPFLGEPFKSWTLAQATWAVVFLVVAVVEGRSLWRIRRLSVG